MANNAADARMSGLDAALAALPRERSQDAARIASAARARGPPLRRRDGAHRRLAAHAEVGACMRSPLPTPSFALRRRPPARCASAAASPAGSPAAIRTADRLRAAGAELEQHECMFLCAAAPLTAAGSEPIEAAVGERTYKLARAALPGGVERVLAQRGGGWRGWEAAAALSAGRGHRRCRRGRTCADAAAPTSRSRSSGGARSKTRPAAANRC